MGFNANGKERASHHHFVHVEGEWHFTTRISDFLKKRQSDKLVQSVAPQCAPCALGVAAGLESCERDGGALHLSKSHVQ